MLHFLNLVKADVIFGWPRHKDLQPRILPLLHFKINHVKFFIILVFDIPVSPHWKKTSQRIELRVYYPSINQTYRLDL